MINGPLDQRTPPMTPQLALRVAAIGGLALVMFALVFFRLWFLQVLDSSHYDTLAQTNVVREIPIAAPRGEIVDSTGVPLATAQAVPAVLIAPESLPAPISLQLDDYVHQPAKDYALYRTLDRILRMSSRPVACKFTVYLSKPHYHDVKLAAIPCLVAKGVAASQYANVTIKTDVPTAVQDYIAERQADFPGVLPNQDVYIRKYPDGTQAAQVIGTLGQITQAEIGKGPYAAIKQGGMVVGQTGLEAFYNQWLQGTPGEEAVKVNSSSQFEGYGNGTAPTQGDTLKTWLDENLEQVGDAALAQSIKLNHGTGGSFVAMDPQNGSVYAMGSLPSYDPSIFVNPISEKTYEQDFGSGSGDPLVNRAIDGALPDGSTFKVITATAALETGDWHLGDIYDDDAPFCFTKGGLCLHNSGNVHYGPLDLQQALEVSDDEFFYNLGLLLNNRPTATQDRPNGGALQEWARKFGIGQPTGVDLPGEAGGEIGTPALLKQRYAEEIDCQNATGPYAYTDNATGQISATKLPGYVRSHKVPAVMDGEEVVSGGCGIASAPYWTEGDNVETGVGQFDDEVTPMQLAVVYAAIANGGKVVTPHIGQSIESPTGTILQNIDPAPKSDLDIKPAYLSAIQQGLYLAANGPTGTSSDVMANLGEKVYGKTGTAELGSSASSPEDAWYACYVPASATSKPIVVVVNVDKGGFGAVAAAPVAREILSQWFYGKPGPYQAGTSTDT